MTRRTRLSARVMAAGLAVAACATAACAQSAEIEIVGPVGAHVGVVPLKAVVRWTGSAVALAGLRGSIVVSGPNGGSASNFTSEFQPAPTVNLGTFSGASRMGMDVASAPPGFTGGVPTVPFGNSSGITVAQYDMTFSQPGVYSARWVPDAGFEGVRLYMNLFSSAILEMFTANVSTVFYVGGCCPTICRADLTGGAIPGGPGYSVPNLVLNNDDFFYYLTRFGVGDRGVCDMTAGAVPGGPGYGQPNGVLNNDDFFFYLALFAEGC